MADLKKHKLTHIRVKPVERVTHDDDDDDEEYVDVIPDPHPLPAVTPPIGTKNTRPSTSYSIAPRKDGKGKDRYCVAVRRYFDYLTSVEGGLLSRKNATQYATNVQSYWNATGMIGMEAFTVERMNSWFLTQHSLVKNKKLAPGTLASYLTVLKNFFNYSLNRGPVVPNASSLMALVGNLGKALRFDKSARRAEKREENTESAIMPVMARSYFVGSAHVQRILASLQAVDHTADQTEIAYAATGVLMILISIKIGCRISAIVNMTARRVRAAKEFTSQGVTSRVIGVPQHKTTAAHGPAELPVSPQTWQALLSYLTMLDRQDDDFVFTDRTGTPYIQRVSAAIKLITKAWKMSGAEAIHGAYSITGVRMTLTTNARSDDPTRADDVAELLCHTRRTADAHYMVADKKKRAADTFASLENLQDKLEEKVRQKDEEQVRQAQDASDDELLEELEVSRSLASVQFPILEQCTSLEDVLAKLPGDPAAVNISVDHLRTSIKSSYHMSVNQSYLRIFNCLESRFFERFNVILREWIHEVFRVKGRGNTDQVFILSLLITDVIAQALGCTIKGTDPRDLAIVYKETDSEPDRQSEF
ncbi:MAG: hypothetical protein ABW168_01650, partial [Sedimenticola sp.]